MKTETEILTSLSDRVGHLERQNYLMKAVALGVVLLMLCGTMVSCQTQPASTTQKKIAAEEFVLVDSDGNKRGEWVMETSDAAGAKPGTQFGSSLRFFAKDQSVLCSLSVGADSGGALIFGAKDGQHFSLVGSSDGMEMLAGAGIDKAVRLTSAQFSGGDIDGIPTYGEPISMYFLELRDENGKEVFNSADYYGFNPSSVKVAENDAKAALPEKVAAFEDVHGNPAAYKGDKVVWFGEFQGVFDRRVSFVGNHEVKGAGETTAWKMFVVDFPNGDDALNAVSSGTVTGIVDGAETVKAQVFAGQDDVEVQAPLIKLISFKLRHDKDVESTGGPPQEPGEQ